MKQHKKDNDRKDRTRTEPESKSQDMRAAMLSGKVPFVFERDRRLLEELALQNSYIRNLFRL